MKKKLLFFLICAVSIPVCACLALYLYAAFYYREGFTFNTCFNGIYCAGMSVESVNDALISQTVFDDLTVSSSYGEDEVIDLDKIVLSVSYKDSLEKIKNEQNPLLWGLNLIDGYNDHKLEPVVEYDGDKLKDAVESLDIVKEYSFYDRTVSIDRSDEGYYLIDDSRPVVNVSAVEAAVNQAVYSKEDALTLDDGLFEIPEYSSKEEAVLKLWDDLSDCFDSDILLDFGDEKIRIDSSILSDFLIPQGDDFARDPENNIVFDEEKIRAYIRSVCEKYNTYGKERSFVCINGENKTLTTSYYGTLIDVKAEEGYLVSAIKDHAKETHEPKYLIRPYHRGLDDIGTDRIEIDLSRQKLYYIVGGKIKMECDVVTGNPNYGRGTPPMVCSIVKKAEKTYLTGVDYRCFVNYWMAVYKTTIGIHDASWQSAFGGERYLTHGSKGCINMRFEDVKQLFSEVEVGFPVLIYK